MRRSAAPSARKSIPTSSTVSNPVIKQVKNGPQSNNIGVRSTDSVLSLLTKPVEIPPLNNKTNLTSASKENHPFSDGKVYKVVWGKKTTRKHKTFEGDGTLHVGDRSAVLKTDEGQFLGKVTNLKTTEFEDGQVISVGSKEVQIVELLPSGNAPPTSLPTAKRLNNDSPELQGRKKVKTKPPLMLNFKSVLPKKVSSKVSYEPLVMPRPNDQHQWYFNSELQPVTEVTVDSSLAKVLRPHQRSGVTFLYECVMGYHDSNYQGAILADEMGLGKTLQCITLIWTLLKQGPYSAPAVARVLIVTPSSLAANWQREFGQWLGYMGTKSTFLVDAKNKPKDYVSSPLVPVLIMSYEMLVRSYEDLQSVKFDLIICDEGHRLKNDSIKVSTVLNQIECKKRVILTGTPIQNDLQEFYSLVNFVNPGILGTNIEYRRYFEDPIVESRQPEVDEEVHDLGEERAKELNRKTRFFILRRTQDVIDKYLPTKTECVVFCKPSELQIKLYEAAIDYWSNREITSNKVAHLSVITNLKKLCNHPSLIQIKVEEEYEESLVQSLKLLLPEWDEMTPQDSGKLNVLTGLLEKLKELNERVVLVSYFTQTLDMLCELCDHNEYNWCRLDGSTPSSQRLDIVNKFNSDTSKTFVFLLSARAGGVGLNLTGASRLILFDSDWNPATDLQAMSRIWRDGQKKSVHIYRFLTTGTIEEKIFQRQISKTGLSGAVVDPHSSNTIRLSDEELKDLFSLNWETDCLTHLSLNCVCSCDGIICENDTREPYEDIRDCQLGNNETVGSQNTPKMNQLLKWEHYKCPINDNILNELALTSVPDGISFIFRNKCVSYC